MRTIADWRRRRASILDGMQRVMGPVPGPEKRCPLDAKVTEEVDCGDYGATRNLRVNHPDCGHLFPVEMREKAYQLLEEGLR